VDQFLRLHFASTVPSRVVVISVLEESSVEHLVEEEEWLASEPLEVFEIDS